MTLQELLVARIRRDGALSVADFMGVVLLHPQYGYYARQVPIGQAGDYTTAPELHQMFGEIIAAWLIDYWQRSSRPASFLLIELGPGRGTLMQDILRTAATVAPPFARAAEIWFVETSPLLRRQQAAAVPNARFAESLASVPTGFSLVVANEFFDALPVHQYVRKEGRWHERAIAWDPSTERFEFVLTPEPAPIGTYLPAAASDGDIAEVSPSAQSIVSDLARRAVADGGTSLIVDYARDRREPAGTLRAVRAHQSVDPLAHPGQADLSTRVDFERLAETARADGATVHGPCAQGAFLETLGLRQRAERLAATQPEQRVGIESAYRRLARPDGMGARFQALAIAGPGPVTPAGFSE